MEITITAAGISDLGRSRGRNEDCFGFDLNKAVFVVCDGVGGSNAGEIASRIAVHAVLDLFPEAAEEIAAGRGGDTLFRCVQQANFRVWETAQTERTYAGMCTTLVAAYFDGARFWIAHVGDSRAYLLRQGTLHRLTDDHSVLETRLRKGLAELPPEEARGMEGVLTQAVGCGDFVAPDITMLAAEDQDLLLLVSDGLTKMLRSSEILNLVLASPSAEEACRALVHAANAAGGEDNITCLLMGIH